jgi:ATP-binding cassette subfamily A (ABC1) protein 3
MAMIMKNLYNGQISLIGIFFIIIAMTFYPAAIVPFLVKEKQIHAKHQQLVSGLNVFAFWIANYMWDVALYMVPLALAMGLLSWFDMTILIGGPDCATCGPNTFEATFWLFLLYGLSICPLSYVLSHGFHEHASAQFYILVLNFVFGLFLMLLSITLDTFIDPTMSIDPATINYYLKYLYRLSPMFNFGNGLVNLSRVSNITTDVFHVNITGLELSYMGGEAGGFFILAVAIDVCLSLPKLRSLFYQRLKPKKPAPGASAATPLDHVPIIIDQDVQEEADRVCDPKYASHHLVALSNLRKVYPSGKVAVEGLSFGLMRGECFGFLGINGAGKTTTLKMLTGDLMPTSGSATMLGGTIDMVTQQQHVRPFIGYCPQFDALFELLTVREHLELYARIKGVPRSDMNIVVMEALTTLQLAPFENKLASTLSGGNKRKLSVAIAMIGAPPVMFLDEPSTGMDPVSRRFLWDVLANVSTVKRESTIVLTTHAMEECEALSSRVGIMVGGALRCIGPVQHLKTRFGHGWTLEVKLEVQTDVDTDVSYICRYVVFRFGYDFHV